MVATWKEIAFKDDCATISAEDPHPIGTEAAAGSESDASAHDHVHVLGGGTVDGTSVELNANALRVVADGITEAKVKDDAIGSEHIEALSAALDFAGNQAQDMVVHQATIGSPPTAVVGKWMQDSATKKFYVCTAT
jgi:hypothetical protein